MAQVINTNIMSLNAQRNLSATQSSLATSVQRLSTGLRVNSAKDDAAGLAIAERMNTQVRDMGQRMRELAVQSANATNTETDRANLNAEYHALAQEIKRNLASASFNGTKLFTSDAALTFQVGANNEANDQIAVTTANLSTATSITNVIDNATGANKGIMTAASATDMLGKLDLMLGMVNAKRAEFGAVQNRFQAVIENLQVNSENQSAARSRIMDADFASETANPPAPCPSGTSARQNHRPLSSERGPFHLSAFTRPAFRERWLEKRRRQGIGQGFCPVWLPTEKSDSSYPSFDGPFPGLSAHPPAGRHGNCPTGRRGPYEVMGHADMMIIENRQEV